MNIPQRLNIPLKSEITHTLSLLILAFIASQRELFLLRYVPAINLSALALTRWWSRRWLGKSRFQPPSVNSNNNSITKGVLQGVQHTFFLWSFTKLDFASGIAIHLLTPAIENAFWRCGNFDAQFVAMLATEVATHAPLHPVFLGLGVLGMLLDLGTRRWDAVNTPPPTTTPKDYSCISALTSALLAVLVGGNVVGFVRIGLDPSWLYVTFLAILSAILYIFSKSSSLTTTKNEYEILIGCLVVLGFAMVTPKTVPFGTAVLFAIITLFVGISWVMEERMRPKEKDVVFEVDMDAVGQEKAEEEEEMRDIDNPSASLLPTSTSTSTTTSPRPSKPSPIFWKKYVGSLSVIFPSLLLLAIQTHLLERSPKGRLTFASSTPSTSNTTHPEMPHTFCRSNPPVSSEPPEVELVISYYSESFEELRYVIDEFNFGFMEKRKDRRKVTVYHKGFWEDEKDEEGKALDRKLQAWIDRPELGGKVDKVVGRLNVGRDGGTHLWHIIENYDNLANFTVFMQGHAPWRYEYAPRLRLINDYTAFVAFGHYLTVTQTNDDLGNGGLYPHIATIWNLTHPPSNPYPTTPHVASYHGEFAVTRERIRNVPKEAYEKIVGMLEAPEGSPIYSEEGSWGWNGVANGPKNPFFGHALERSWASMFGCEDPGIARVCGADGRNWRGCVCEKKKEEA